MRIWDISEPIEEATATFPGDTPFSREWVLRLERGDSCNVSTIRMSAHLGTHTDAPLHFDRAGADMASVDLRRYVGPCRVVSLRGEGRPPLIPAAALARLQLAGIERLLVRTRGGHDHRAFDGAFTAVGPDAAAALVAAGVLLVGIDTPSIDHATSKDLAGHHVLHRAGVAILENLDLSRVPDGDYELIALPLRIVGGDSSPVRAVLRELPPPTAAARKDRAR
jgi:arylformamidase